MDYYSQKILSRPPTEKYSYLFKNKIKYFFQLSYFFYCLFNECTSFN